MAKRISSSSVNWALIAEKIGAENKGAFMAFKGKSDKFLRAVESQPAELPKIDWSVYKSKISVSGFVDSYQKSYETLKIPYPSDQGFLAKVDQQEAENIKKAAAEDEENLKKLAECQETLKKLEGILPYSEMSLEEYFLACPEEKIDADNPRLWPQNIDKDLPDNPPKQPGGHH